MLVYRAVYRVLYRHLQADHAPHKSEVRGPGWWACLGGERRAKVSVSSVYIGKVLKVIYVFNILKIFTVFLFMLACVLFFVVVV